MKPILIIIAFFIINPQDDCDGFRFGKFEMDSNAGGKIIVERSATLETQTLTRTGSVAQYKLKWLSKCNYITFDRKLIKGKEISTINPNIDTVYHEIISTKGKEVTIKVTIPGYDTVKCTLRKLN